jgi:hypothetical protein
MVCDDLELIAAGLPPVRMQQAAPELVGRYRNRPVNQKNPGAHTTQEDKETR